MQEVLDQLSSDAEEFSARQEEDFEIEVDDSDVFLCWRKEFDRMIYNHVRDSERVQVGIMLVNQNQAGSVGFRQEAMTYASAETAESAWAFCYETANKYCVADLETRRQRPGKL